MFTILGLLSRIRRFAGILLISTPCWPSTLAFHFGAISTANCLSYFSGQDWANL